jgi:4-hydroxy-3-polyprenylbenzoate decarboxylase
MGYRNLQACVRDLEKHHQLIRIDSEIDPHLEAGAIQRRVYAAGGPALLFTRIKGCRFPMLGNLFGTLERTRFLFRDTLPTIEKLVNLKLNPLQAFKQPFSLPGIGLAALNLLPKTVREAPSTAGHCSLSDLPQLVSWPDDGGAFITLPQVYSEHPLHPGYRQSNLGMYRVQISGNHYKQDEEAGMHYQIHRGIGIHHSTAIKHDQPLKVNVFVGGPPSLSVAAVMPLPEGMPELSFAGLLGGHRIPMQQLAGQLPVPAEADFCLVGEIDLTRRLPEGPFGDHLGYYSLTHDFPVMRVTHVYHRSDAIWPFTTVGRPPQEDTSFGTFIHELTGDLIPDVLPGVRAVHAVDAAGVHPLLLAIGSERYTPGAPDDGPMEILTQASAILGQGQLSLAKYLWITAEQTCPNLDLHDLPTFFRHMLERVDWRRDLHFITRTSIDTLDYSGSGLNRGSKLVIAATGPAKRELPTRLPENLSLTSKFINPQIVMPGILAISGPQASTGHANNDPDIESFCATFADDHPLNEWPLVLIVDDSSFCAASLENFVWTTFTRSDPAADIYGIGSGFSGKHWGCRGAMVIDARIKPHHAPPLIDDPEIERRVDTLGAPGGALHNII